MVLTVLGVELDSVLIQAQLPKEEFDHISSLLIELSPKRHCKCKELVSHIGNLHQPCKVAP